MQRNVRVASHPARRAGIEDMRATLHEKMLDKLKNKGKQRMRPKMGRMDIDYNLMQEAFFKKQHKPSMTPLGDLYYEGALGGCSARVRLRMAMQYGVV